MRRPNRVGGVALSWSILLLLTLKRPRSAIALIPPVSLPLTETALVQQVATAVHSAFTNEEQSFHRQQIKLPLSESMYSSKEEGFVADRAIGWQGGPRETYRYLEPLASAILKQVSEKQAYAGGLVAKVRSQPLLDFDGSALLTAEHPAGPLYDVQAMLQPNTDKYYLDTIERIEEQFSDTPGKAKRLFLVLNPAWRDESSWGFFEAQRAQQKILNRYEITYALDQFVVRGTKISLLRAYPHDWAVFMTPMPYAGSDTGPTLIGTFAERPEYDVLDKLILKMTSKKTNDST